jgi:hypothetical protein
VLLALLVRNAVALRAKRDAAQLAAYFEPGIWPTVVHHIRIPRRLGVVVVVVVVVVVPAALLLLLLLLLLLRQERCQPPLALQALRDELRLLALQALHAAVRAR